MGLSEPLKELPRNSVNGLYVNASTNYIITQGIRVSFRKTPKVGDRVLHLTINLVMNERGISFEKHTDSFLKESLDNLGYRLAQGVCLI